MAFRGTFSFSLDAKHRLTVPSKLRAPFAEGVVVAAAVDPCVALWRPSDYEAFVAASLAEVPKLDPRRRKLERFFHANSFEAE